MSPREGEQRGERLVSGCLSPSAVLFCRSEVMYTEQGPEEQSIYVVQRLQGVYKKNPASHSNKSKSNQYTWPYICDLQLHSPPRAPLEVQPRILGTSWSAVWKVLGKEAEGYHRLQVSGSMLSAHGKGRENFPDCVVTEILLLLTV